MASAASRRAITVVAALALTGMSSFAVAQMQVARISGAPLVTLLHSPVPGGRVHRAGLWNKPNEACQTQCQVFVDKGCFKRLSEQDPGASAAALQERCEDKYSLCLYDCMCDTCDENQIIIKQ